MKETAETGWARHSESESESEPLLINGRRCAELDVADRAIHYGDGLFETIRVRDGMPCLWERHWARLGQGGDRLGIPLPPWSLIRDEAAALIEGMDEGVLKLILTRGRGGRGYRPPQAVQPTRILIRYPMPDVEVPNQITAVTIRYCQTPASVNSRLAGLKHLNRLDAVLARSEWDDPGIAEGLMNDAWGAIVGGTMTNLFLWDGRGLATPAVTDSGVAGTVRALAIDLASSLGVPCMERVLTAADVERAQGAFLTNARIGVWAAQRIAGKHFDPNRLPLAFLGQLKALAHASAWPACPSGSDPILPGGPPGRADGKRPC